MIIKNGDYFKVGFVGSDAGKIGDISNGYEYYLWPCADSLYPSGLDGVSLPTVEHVSLPSTFTVNSDCRGSFAGNFWQLFSENCHDSSRPATYKYTFSNKDISFQFHLLIYIHGADWESETDVSNGSGFVKMH